MFLVHRVLHPATAVHQACWCRVAGDAEELVLSVGRELHVYGITAGSLNLKRVWRFEQRVEACASARRPAKSRDALVIAFAPSRIVIIDDEDGEPQTLVRYDLETQQDLLDNDPFKLTPLKANKGGPSSWPIVLDTASSIACVRAKSRVVAVPLMHCAARDVTGRVPPPFFVDGSLPSDVVVRLLAFAPAGPPTVILCCADARGDTPSSTSLIALGLDAASKKAYPRWRVDCLAAAPRGLIPLRKGGAVVLFRHSLARVSSGGAVDAVALNGFANEDFGPSDPRAVVRPNAPKLAIDATAGCAGCEVSDGLCLVSLPGAASLWIADVTGVPSLRPLASAAPCRVVRCSPDNQRVFLGGGCDDGVLCDVRISRDVTKKRKTGEALYGKLNEGAVSLTLTAADAVVALGSLVDATFAARTSHRWPFQPQREGDGRKAAREARRSGRSELVGCAPGAGDGSRGHVVCLGRGARPACLGHFRRTMTTVIGGLKWKGPFRGKEATSRETATRDVLIASCGEKVSWFLFDGQTLSEHELEASGSLLGVVASDEPLDASSIVYLIYEQSWQSLKDGAPVKTGKLAKQVTRVTGDVHAGYVAVCSDGKTRVLNTAKGLKVGKVLLDDECDCISVAKAPASLWTRTSTTSSSESEGWHASTAFDERAYLYGAPTLDVKPEKLAAIPTLIGVSTDGALIASSLNGEELARFERATEGYSTLGSSEDMGDTPRCACVSLHRVGPKLALDALGKWVLCLVLREGDLVVYEYGGQWRRVAHDFLGRPDAGTSQQFSLTPFDDIESRSGVMVHCARPAVILCERGKTSVVPIESFSGDDCVPMPRHTASVPLPTNRGFLLRGGEENVICAGLGNLVLAATSATLTVHKAPIRDGSPYSIRALNAPPDHVDAAPAFALLCASRRDPSLGVVVDADAEPSTEPPTTSKKWPLDCLSDSRLGGAPVSRQSNAFELRLVTSAGWRTLQRCPLGAGERGVCLDICALAKKVKDVATRNTYACVGTCVETSYGEDAASRGRILLFEVDYVPCRRKSRQLGGKGRAVGHAPRFTLTHAKKVRGAVSQITQVMEHIIVSVANRVEIYAVEGAELKQIATHHAPHYVVSLRVAKTYIIYADVYQACTLLFWRDRDRQLYPLAKDADAHERRAVGDDLRADGGSYCADFVVDAGEMAGAHALGVVVGDGDRVRLLQYAPLGSDTDRGGQRLLARADFMVNSDVHCLARHAVPRTDPDSDAAAFACFYAGLDGQVGAFLPCDEKTFRRLRALEGVLGNALKHAAGVHPDKHRLASLHARNVLDGALLFRYCSLARPLQRDLALAVGTDRATVLETLRRVDGQVGFL